MKLGDVVELTMAKTINGLGGECHCTWCLCGNQYCNIYQVYGDTYNFSFVIIKLPPLLEFLNHESKHHATH
jgi:hypothetical protein